MSKRLKELEKKIDNGTITIDNMEKFCKEYPELISMMKIYNVLKGAWFVTKWFLIINFIRYCIELWLR